MDAVLPLLVQKRQYLKIVHQLRGLAWSGKDKIKRVDVSLDGGKNGRLQNYMILY